MAKKTRATRKKASKRGRAGTASGERATWDPDNTAHNMTWILLLMFAEIDEVFPNAKDIRMTGLAYWNRATTAPVRRIQARAVAGALHRFLREEVRAGYETALGRGEAEDMLTGVLTDPRATVHDLGVKVDEIFHFRTEDAA